MLSSLLGNIKKAKLIIQDKPPEKIDSQSFADTSSGLLGALTPTLPSFGGGSEFQVQYNPSSITIESSADPIPILYLQSEKQSSIPIQNGSPPSVVMMVDLIFDDVNNKDAFNDLAMPTISLGGAIQTISNIFKTQTVQPQTNGLLAALARSESRMVTFAWAEMVFTGVLTRCEAKYTMFSPKGRPIRSTVSICINQMVASKADVKYWDKAVAKAFNDKGGLLGAITGALGL